MKYAHIYTLFLILAFCTSCGGQNKPGLAKEKEHPKLIKDLGNGNISFSLQDKSGDIWFGTANGLYKYDGKSFRHFLLSDGQNINDVSCLLKDRNGKIWIGTGDGLILYDGKTFDKFTSFTKNDGLSGTGLVAKIIEDKKGIIWLGGDGLSRYDGNSFTSFRDGLINPGIWSLFEEKSGNIWVGTREAGFYLFDGKKFINYSEYKR